jgi:hypothetical protein
MDGPGPWWVPLLQAFIQAAGVVTAASIGLVLWRRQVLQERLKGEDRQRIENQAAEARRRERVRDMLIALRAEISVDIERLELVFGEPGWVDLRVRMLERLAETRVAKDNKDMPQGPSVDDHFVFEAIKSELTLLPENAIGPVVRYYRHARFLDELARAFSSGMFEGLADVRQIEAVDQYLLLGRTTLKLALDAQSTLEANGASLNEQGPANRPALVRQDG